MADYDPPYRSRRNNPDDAPPPSRYRERTNDASPGDRLARAPTAPAQDRDLRDRGDRDRGDRGDRDRLARNVTDVGPRERDRDRDRERDRDRDRDRDRERRDDQPEGERERGYRGGADLQRDRRRDPSRPAGAERRDRSRPPLDRLDRDYRDRERERDPDRDRYAPETRDGRDPRDLRMDRDPSKGRDGRDPRDARDLRDGRDIRERPSARTREPTEDGRSERGEGRRPGAGINDLLKDLGDFAAKDGPPSGGKPEDPLPDPRLAGQSTRVPIIPRGSSRRNNTGRADPRDEAGPQTSSDATSDAGRSGRSRSIERSRGEGSQPSARPLRNLMERTGTLDSRSGRPAPTVTDDDGKTAVGGVPNLANPPRKRNGSISSSSVTAIETAIADPSAISSMLPDALNDSKSYAVLTPERIEDRRREFAVLSSQVSSLQNRLTLESRIREAALNVAKSTSPNDRAQAKAAQEQLSAANRKVDAIATDLWKVTGKLMEVERVVLKHTAGVLRFCVNNDTDGKKGNAQSTSPADRVKLESAETKVKEYEKEISVLKSTISRLENDNADTKKELSKEQDNLRRAERSLADNDRIIRSLESEVKSQRSRGPMSPVGNNEVNRLKLELATCRAEMATHQEDLTLAREKLDKQQNEMDELVQNMDEKDRMISNLLGELEEVTNKLEMKTAANDALMSAGVSTGPIATTPASSSASERQLRAQVAALEAELREATKAIAQGGSRSSTIMREQVAQQVNVQTENVRALLSKQLKDAVTEREKLKAQLANERARATDLEFEVSDLRDRLESGGGSRRGGGRGGSDTEDEGYGKPRSRGITTRKGGKDDGPGAVSDADLRALQRLHSDLPSLTPTRAAADSSDSSPFSVDGLVTKVTRLLTEKRDLARTRDAMDEDLRRARDDAEDALGTVRKLESDLRRAKDDAATAARAAEVAERDLKSQLRAAERAVDRLKEDLAEAERRGQQAESMSSVSATNATKKLEEAQAAHARELANANERAESADPGGGAYCGGGGRQVRCKGGGPEEAARERERAGGPTSARSGTRNL
ncbi:Up-regulated during septation-domain-containing protein [Zopfochytrium polystomum]|nr:Up-regulated during septation-domain-containing protein [Zopfochytrium polystomum]